MSFTFDYNAVENLLYIPNSNCNCNKNFVKLFLLADNFIYIFESSILDFQKFLKRRELVLTVQQHSLETLVKESQYHNADF